MCRVSAWHAQEMEKVRRPGRRALQTRVCCDARHCVFILYTLRFVTHHETVETSQFLEKDAWPFWLN